MSIGVVVPALRPLGAVEVLERVAGTCDAAIIVDNSGGDVARAVRARAPWARVIVPERNLGFGAAVMEGVNTLSTDVVVFINDDVRPHPGFLEHLVSAFAADPLLQQASCRLDVVGTEDVDSVGLSFDRTLLAENVTRLRRGSPANRVLGPSGAAAAYRREEFLRLGGFAPELFAYWEDADLALRMWSAGHRCTYVPQARADHARGTALKGRSVVQRRLDAYGRGFVLGRYASWLGPIDRLLVPLVDWPSLVRGSLQSGDLSLMRARRAGWRQGRAVPSLRHRRSSPPKSRGVPSTVIRQLVGVVRPEFRSRAAHLDWGAEGRDKRPDALPHHRSASSD